MTRFEQFREMMAPAQLPAECTDWLLNETDFFTAPASTIFHGAYEGGLFDHSYEVTKALLHLSEALSLTWEKPRSPLIVGMFHDLCKTNRMEKVTSGDKTIFRVKPNVRYDGHGIKSVDLLSRWLTLTEEESLCILHHMGAYETKTWNALDRAIRRYPNVLWTHTADMFASKVLDT